MKAGVSGRVARAFVFLIQMFVLVFGMSTRSGELEIGPWTAALIKSVPKPVGSLIIERNAQGALVGVTVSGAYANDESFREISAVPTLERLEFSYFSRSNLLTPAGISALSKAPRLSEVVFQCNKNVPDSFYWALGQLRQIQTLRFVATWPPDHIAARPLTNLVALKRIWISFSGHFSADDIEILNQMKSLREVKLTALHVDERALTPLLENTTITNLEIKAGNFKVVRARGDADYR